MAAPRSAQALDAVLELLRPPGRDTAASSDASADEAVGVRATPLREPLVLRLDDPIREVAVGDAVPPEAVDAQRLDVDALLVDELEAVLAQHPGAATAGLFLERRALDDRGHLGHRAVGVQVDDADTLATDADFASGDRRGLGHGAGVRQTASRHEHSRRRAGDGLEEIPAIRHGLLLGARGARSLVCPTR